MSWLFGYSSKPPQPPPENPIGDGGGAAAAAPAVNLSRSEKKAMEAYRFDSSALERAAQAAKELESSSKQYIARYVTHCAVLHKRRHNLTP